MSGLLPPDCSVGPGVADLTITSIGGRNPIVIEASEIGITWEINQTSALLADVALSAWVKEFQPIDSAKGHWISWYGNALGKWAGVITGISADPMNGTARLTCVDFSYYLGRRLLPTNDKVAKVITGCAGGVADVLLKYGERDDTLWLTDVDYEDSDFFISVQVNGQNLLQQLRQNASDTEQEFRVDESRAFLWRGQLGDDLTSTVQLNEGVEIASAQPNWDISEVVNDLVVAPSQQNYSARYSRRTQDDASIDAIGRGQDRFVTSDAIRPSAIRAIGKRRLTRSAALGRTLTADVVNVNECFSLFSEGDVIRVVLPSINLATDARVLQRGYTLSDGVLALTMEI